MQILQPMIPRIYLTRRWLRPLSLLLLFASWGLTLRAQPAPDTTAFVSNARSISLLAKHYGDSIVLRWAPVTAGYWYTHLHKACIVARREVAPNPGDYVVISDSIRLMPEDDLEAMAAAMPDHPLLVVLLQNAYRDWENSLYDGDIASMQEKADNFNNRWSLTLFAADRDPVVATAAGFRFVDPHIKPGVTYAYKVLIPGTYTGGDYKVVSAGLRSFRPIIYQGFERDSSLVIQWQKRLHDPHYSAYFIERSSDGEHFVRLHTLPYIQASDDHAVQPSHFYTYMDPVADGGTYHYRLIGLDAFGDLSAPSLPVALKTRDLTPPAPAAVDASIDSTARGIRITWEPAVPDDAAGFVITLGLGGNDPTPVSDMLPASARSFFHEPGDYNGVGTYRVMTIDSAGNAGASNPQVVRVPDFAPPAPPNGLEAVPDTAGFIRVRWAPATEEDVIGYFVYAADGDDRHFERLTPKLYPFRQYTDTIDLYSLTRKRMYKIVAVDDALNYSEYSAVLAVDRPDIVPPSPAWIQDYQVTPTAVTLYLVPSTSRDVVRHEVWRRSNALDDWSVIATLSAVFPDHRYTDTLVESGRQYLYTLVAIDGNEHASKILNERHITVPMDRSARGIQFSLITAKADSARIEWQADRTLMEVEVLIHRSASWQRLGRVPAEQGQYPLPGYRNEPLLARLVFPDGSRSSVIPILQ